jgi:hypothetical protein
MRNHNILSKTHCIYFYAVASNFPFSFLASSPVNSSHIPLQQNMGMVKGWWYPQKMETLNLDQII